MTYKQPKTYKADMKVKDEPLGTPVTGMKYATLANTPSKTRKTMRGYGAAIKGKKFTDY